MEKQLNRNQIQEILNQRPQTMSKQQVIDGLVARGYQLEGLNAPKSVTQKVTGALKERASNVVEAVKDVGQAQGVTETLAQAGRVPLRALGQAAGAVGDVIGETVVNPALQATGLDKPLAQGVQAVAESGVGQAIKSGLSQVPQPVKEAVGDVANVAGLVTGGTGAKVAGETVGKGVVKGAEAVQGNLKKLVDTIPTQKVTSPENAVLNIKSNLLSQIEGKATSLKALAKQKTGVLDTIAADPRYHPDIDIDNKAFNTTNAVNALNEDISSNSELLKSLFAKVDETQGLVKPDTIVGNVIDKVLNEKNKLASVVGGKGVFKDIGDILDRVKTQYANGMSRSDIWELRKMIDDSVNAISDTNLKKNIRVDVRNAFKTTLEESVPGNKIVKSAMGELEKLIEARNYSQDILNGFKIRGGKLTDVIRNAVVSDIGRGTGAILGVGGGAVGGVAGSIGGAIAGFAASKQIGEWLAKNTLSSAADRKALQDLIVSQPNVWKDIKKMVREVPVEDKVLLLENIVEVESTMDKVKNFSKKAIEDYKNMPNQQGGFISTGATTDLIKEAKKYKSAEEFVKAQGSDKFGMFNRIDTKNVQEQPYISPFSGYKGDFATKKTPSGLSYFASEKMSGLSTYLKNGGKGNASAKDFRGIYSLDKVINNPALFEKYPTLKRYNVVFADFHTPSRYGIHVDDTIYINSKLYEADPAKLESTIVHEIQHAKQKITGKNADTGGEFANYAKKYNSPAEVDARAKQELYKEHVKTKSQLEQIWKEAQQTGGSTKINPLNAIAGSTAIVAGANAIRNKKSK